MTWFQTTYTVRYNARHRVSGHLFAGRYKAILIDPASAGYFTAVHNYIHLNPVRAGMVALTEGASLLDYPWSSLPGYLKPRQRPAWLEVEHALAALQWRDTGRDRRAFLEYTEGLARQSGEEAMPASSLQSTLRRGWYFGTEEFREALLEKMGELISRKRATKQNYHGAEIRDHGEAEARKIIAQRLREVGLSSGELGSLPKSDVRKAAIAQEVRRRTSVSLQFLARELAMGTTMNVSRLSNWR